MPISRSILNALRGPAVVKIGTTYIYFKDGLDLDEGLKTAQVAVAGIGSEGRYDDIVMMLSGTPVGMWDTTRLGLLLPNLSRAVGASIVGAGTDVPLAVIPMNCPSQRITFPAYGVMKMPELNLSPQPGVNLFGSMQFVLPVKNNTAWSNSAARFAFADDATFPDASGFDFADILNPAFTLSLAGGSAPWDGIVAEGAIKVSWNEKIGTSETANDGSVDFYFEDAAPRVEVTAANVDIDDAFTKLLLQDTGAARGRGFMTDAVAITATAGSGLPQFTATYARLSKAPQQWKGSGYRNKSLTFEIMRNSPTAAFASVGLAS